MLVDKIVFIYDIWIQVFQGENSVKWDPLVVGVQSQWANGNHCSISFISLVDIRPLKMCHIIYSPLIVIEYTHWECTGRTLKEDWVQEDLPMLFLALPWVLVLILFFLRLILVWFFHPIQTKALGKEISSNKDSVIFSFRDIMMKWQQKKIKLTIYHKKEF